MGVGTRAWGDRLIWNYGKDFDRETLYQAYLRAINDQCAFFFTNEAFSDGDAEKILGVFNQRNPGKCYFCSKYAPRPWIVRRSDFLQALRHSLSRLNLTTLDVYEILPPSGAVKLDVLAECVAEAFNLGLFKNIGVSNFSVEQAEEFNDALGKYGARIFCFEAKYNLLCRDVETNGVLDFCRKNDICLIAQEPLAMGVLSGRYMEEEPVGFRRNFIEEYEIPGLEFLLRTMSNIGSEQGGKNCAQVALNWLIGRGAFPIPGATSLEQVTENDSSIGWNISAAEMTLLNETSDKVLEREN